MKRATTSIDLHSKESTSELKDLAWREVKKSLERLGLTACVDGWVVLLDEQARGYLWPLTWA